MKEKKYNEIIKIINILYSLNRKELKELYFYGKASVATAELCLFLSEKAKQKPKIKNK